MRLRTASTSMRDRLSAAYDPMWGVSTTFDSSVRGPSYGSLANADGAEGRPHSREELRKSREMQQMLHELDLSADELERSEARPGLYRGPDSVSQLSHHSHHSGFRRL